VNAETAETKVMKVAIKRRRKELMVSVCYVVLVLYELGWSIRKGNIENKAACSREIGSVKALPREGKGRPKRISQRGGTRYRLLLARETAKIPVQPQTKEVAHVSREVGSLYQSVDFPKMTISLSVKLFGEGDVLPTTDTGEISK